MTDEDSQKMIMLLFDAIKALQTSQDMLLKTIEAQQRQLEAKDNIIRILQTPRLPSNPGLGQPWFDPAKPYWQYPIWCNGQTITVPHVLPNSTNTP